ncbi:hypothetical protein [Fulvimarina sp. MAC3]|uniref:hypothetical protein n=1 Tax=Fulvimarina sp. MAC3 TaxID=3148887 RepID=UPI0031FC5DA5
MNLPSERYTGMVRQAKLQCDDIMASSFENWSEALTQVAFEVPIHSVLFGPSDLNRLLSSNANYASSFGRRPQSVDDRLAAILIDLPSEGHYFPKIGPVSWKERPEAYAVSGLRPFDRLALLASCITDRMAASLQIFVEAEVPTYLHFFPLRDMTMVPEARITVRSGRVSHARWSRPAAARDYPGVRASLMSFARATSAEMPMSDVVLDLCIDDRSQNGEVRLIEFNPKLAEVS